MTLRIPMAFIALASFGFVGSAYAANMCQAGKMNCATTMPVGGYCECTSRGTTTDGTVVAKPAARRSTNATPGGCGANPSAPGCR